MQVINRKQYIFRTRPQWRMKGLVAALSFISVLNFFAISAQAQEGEAFKRLSKPQVFLNKPIGDDGGAIYSVAGGSLRFKFTRQDRKGKIFFLCPLDKGECGVTHELIAKRSVRGELVFRDVDDKPVLTLTSAGGGTLFGGSSFVPPGVPEGGVAIVLAE